MAQSTIQTRLCPHCANSVALDALTCPYCKARLEAAPAPQWPSQAVEQGTLAQPGPSRKPLIWAVVCLLALLAAVGGGYFIAVQRGNGDQTQLLEAKDKALRESADKAKALEEQLAQSRAESKTSAAELEELKTKLSAQDKLLVAAHDRLKEMSRESDRLASRAVVTAPPATRPRDPIPSSPAPVPAPSAAPRRVVEPGLYETVRSTSVHEEPLAGSRVLSRIASGTQITVVRGVGEWLEVRSKIGNPPGFVRADDAMLVSRAN